MPRMSAVQSAQTATSRVTGGRSAKSVRAHSLAHPYTRHLACMKKCAYCGGGRHSEDICLSECKCLSLSHEVADSRRDKLFDLEKKEHIRNGQLDTTQSALKAKSNATTKYQTNEVECKACFKRGHNADECRTICSNCDKTGHDWRTCTSGEQHHRCKLILPVVFRVQEDLRLLQRILARCRRLSQ